MTKKIVYTLSSLCRVLLLGGILNTSCNNSKSVHMKSATSSSKSSPTESIPTKSNVPDDIWLEIFPPLDSQNLQTCRLISNQLNTLGWPYLKERFYLIRTKFEELTTKKYAESTREQAGKKYAELTREQAEKNMEADFENKLAIAKQEGLTHIAYHGVEGRIPQLVKAITSLTALKVHLVNYHRENWPRIDRIGPLAMALSEKPEVSRLDLNLWQAYMCPDEGAEAQSLSKLKYLTYLSIEGVDSHRFSIPHNQPIEAIATLTKLTHLRIDGIFTESSPLAHLSQLKQLCIKKEGGITSQELQALSTLEELEGLDITNKKDICPMCISHLNNERKRTNKGIDATFSSQAISSLFNLKKLKTLYINQVQVDESGRKIIADLQAQGLNVIWV